MMAAIERERTWWCNVLRGGCELGRRYCFSYWTFRICGQWVYPIEFVSQHVQEILNILNVFLLKLDWFLTIMPKSKRNKVGEWTIIVIFDSQCSIWGLCCSICVVIPDLQFQYSSTGCSTSSEELNIGPEFYLPWPSTEVVSVTQK